MNFVQAWRRFWLCHRPDQSTVPPSEICLRGRWHPGSCRTFKDGPESFAIPLDTTWTRIENMEIPADEPWPVPDLVPNGTSVTRKGA